MRDVIEATVPNDAVFITNWTATRKFVSIFDRKYFRVERDLVTPLGVQQLTRRYGSVYLVLITRNDSEHWLRDGVHSEQFLRSLRNVPDPIADVTASATDRIRVWRLDRDSPVRRR